MIRFKVSAALIICFLFGCGEFDIGQQHNTKAELLLAIEHSKPCEITEAIKLYSIPQTKRNAYIAVLSNGEDIPIRLLATNFTLGGYKLEGVSHIGHYKLNASVNLLSNNGVDVTIEKLTHYKNGDLVQNKYSFCKF